MGRWDFLADHKPQELKDYVLDQVADRLAEELRAYPPSIEEWLDDAARGRFQRALARSSQPGSETLRVACDLQTFMDLALRQLTPSQALKDHRATIVHGTRTSFTEIFRVLVYEAR